MLLVKIQEWSTNVEKEEAWLGEDLQEESEYLNINVIIIIIII